MALYIKLVNEPKDEEDYVRFRSAVKFFNVLSSNLNFSNVKTYVYFGDQFDESVEIRDYDFGLLETHFRPKLRKLVDKSSRLGLIIEGKICFEDKTFEFSYDLIPRVVCLKDRFDIRLEILPNKYAEIFEDLVNFREDLKAIILNRIKTYNSMKDYFQYKIKRAVLSKHGDEYNNIGELSRRTI